MKYYILYREDDNFDDILSDSNIKKLFKLRIKYYQHIILAGDKIPDDLQSYIVLKHGDDIIDIANIFIDRKPIPFKDYTPILNQITKI